MRSARFLMAAAFVAAVSGPAAQTPAPATGWLRSPPVRTSGRVKTSATITSITATRASTRHSAGYLGEPSA